MSDGQNSFPKECTQDRFKYLTILEKEIIEALASLNQKAVKVSFVLSRLDLSFMIKEISQKSPFSPESFLKLYLYKRIKVIRKYPDILKQLQEDEQQAYHLGFRKDENNESFLPKKRTYNQFVREHVNKELKEFLGTIAERILSIATQHGILIDLEIIKKKVKENNENHKKKIREATRLVKKLVYPQIDIKIKENGKFTTKDLLDVLIHVAQTHDFCNNGSVTFQELNPDAKCPHGNTLMYHFKKLKSIDKIKSTFETVFDVIFNFTKQNYKELRRRQLDIAIDIHKIPYYGDKNDPYVTEGEHERGTTHFYQFLTCSIVVAGRRFTIDAIPIHKLDNIEELVNQIIKRTKQKININKAYLDRGFDKPKVINILKQNRIRFIMPKIKSDTVKAWMRKSEACKSRIIEDFEIGTGENKAIVNLILVDDEEGIKRAFITNFYIPEQLAHYLYEWYSKRWGIETSYRQLDHDFKAKTTSKNYNIRLFYFLFTVCLYNLWILVNICVSLTLYGRILEKPIVTAKLFSIILYRISIEDPPT